MQLFNTETTSRPLSTFFYKSFDARLDGITDEAEASHDLFRKKPSAIWLLQEFPVQRKYTRGLLSMSKLLLYC